MELLLPQKQLNSDLKLVTYAEESKQKTNEESDQTEEIKLRDLHSDEESKEPQVQGWTEARVESRKADTEKHQISLMFQSGKQNE